MRSVVVVDAICIGVQMELSLAGELHTDELRGLGRPVGVQCPRLEDKAFARAGGESLAQMRFAAGLDPVFASRKSSIRHPVGDVRAKVEGRIFGRAGEGLSEAMRFAGAFDIVFDGMGRESYVVGELLADTRSPSHVAGVVGVSGLGRAVS